MSRYNWMFRISIIWTLLISGVLIFVVLNFLAAMPIS
jgi:hypothetical protein